MNKLFVTSDLHFGHKNIIRYCQRPFKDVDSMNTHLINRWNTVVGDKDTVLFLGDFSLGLDDGGIAQKLSLLNGDIKVVLGNHDQPDAKWGMSGLKKVIVDYSLKRVEVMNDIHEFSMNGVGFVCCHFPLAEWHHKDRGVVHLHGHLHTQQRDVDMLRARRNKIYEIGVDIYGCPVEITSDLRHLNKPIGWVL